LLDLEFGVLFHDIDYLMNNIRDQVIINPMGHVHACNEIKYTS
jgi:hypothetical protein